MNLEQAIERNRKREAEKKDRWNKRREEILRIFNNPPEVRTRLDEIFNFKGGE